MIVGARAIAKPRQDLQIGLDRHPAYFVAAEIVPRALRDNSAGCPNAFYQLLAIVRILEVIKHEARSDIRIAESSTPGRCSWDASG